MKPTEYEKLISDLARRMTNSSHLADFGLIKWGTSNKWIGKSSFPHQIDVSLENNQELLLVECKYWNKKKNLPIDVALVMLARVFDISYGSQAKGRLVRGALVTTKDFQSGTYILAGHYSKEISLFVVNSIDDFIVKFHEHYLQNVGGIRSHEAFGNPTMTLSNPPE